MKYCVLSWDGAHFDVVTQGKTLAQVRREYPEAVSGEVSITGVHYTYHRHGSQVNACPGCPRCAVYQPDYIHPNAGIWTVP